MINILIGYMWLYIHRPFEEWTWLAAFRVERVYMILTILFFLLGGFAKWTSNRINLAVGCFFVAMLVCWFASPFMDQEQGLVEDYFKRLVFYVLVMASVRDEKDLKKLVVGFLAAMGLYMLHSAP